MKNGGDAGVTSASSDVDRRSCGLASSPRRVSRGRTVGLGLHRGDGVTKDSELHRLVGRGARHEGGQPGQVTTGGEPDEPDALGTCGPPAADLGAQRVQRRRVPDVDRVAEHARLHAHLAEPAGHRLGFVRGVLGIPAAGQDDHVRAGGF